MIIKSISKTFLYFLIFAATVYAGSSGAPPAFQCRECHSKRTGALAMHRAVNGTSCFNCHVRGEKLRQKGGIPQEKHEAFLVQRVIDERCVSCHGDKMQSPSENEPMGSKPSFASGTYCPRCAMTGGVSWKFCPKCGGEVLNLEEVIQEAATCTDDSLCRQCHDVDQTLSDQHADKLAQDFNHEDDCLTCHQSHSKCGGCH